MSKKMNMIERFQKEVFGVLKRLRRYRKGGALPHFRGMVCPLPVLYLIIIPSFVICHLLFVISPAQGAFPQQINYQGKLTNAGNIPVSNANYSIVFTIYDAASSGTNKWTETQSVTTESGFFNVILGSSTPIGTDVFDGNDRWLGVKVGSDAEMTPRQKLTAVGHAFYTYNADKLDGHDWSEVPTGGNYVLKAGDTMTGTLTNSATASFRAADGSVGVPSYSFTSDPDTGFYKAAVSDLRLAIDGALVAEWTSAGHYTNQVSPVGAVSMAIKGAVADGATAIGAKIGNTNTLSTSGAKIASFYSDNLSTEKAYITKDGTIVSSGLIRGVSLESTVATGTAPLTVASSTVVTNLNADLLDGSHASAFATTGSLGNYVLKAGDTMTGTLTNSATASFQAANGSAAVPSYSFSGDPNTGIFTPSSDRMDLVAGGTVQLAVTSGTLYFDSMRALNLSSLLLRGAITDSSSAIGVKVGNANTLTTPGAKIISFYIDNGTVEKAYIDKDGTLVSSGLVRAVSLESTVATGTAPLTVASSTVVTNLNADYLDGSHASAFATTGSLGNYVLKAGDTMTGTLTNSATSSFQAANGSAATPSYSFSSDPDTGFYSDSPNVIRFASNGASVGQIAGTQMQINNIISYTAATMTVKGQVADGASAVGTTIGSYNALSTSGAKIASFVNAATEKAYIDKDGTIVSSGLVRGVSLESTVATGTAPLTVASTTVVTNLNADLLDGSHASAFATTGSLGNYVLKAGDTMTGTLTNSATASFQAANGSVVAPSYTFTSDPDTGFYYPGFSGYLAFSSNNALTGYWSSAAGLGGGNGMIQTNNMRAMSGAFGIEGSAANGATAVGIKIGNANLLTTAGAKIVNFYDGGAGSTEKAFIDKDGTINSSGLVRGVSLESTVATGTAPLTVASTTKVTNLNADLLDGLDSTDFSTTSSDYGRSGVAADLYESTTKLTDKYVKKAGDTMTGTLTNSATSSFQAANGSAASPSYTFTSDPNTGIYRVGEDQLGFAVNGYYVGTITDSWMRAVAFTSYSTYSVDMVGQIPNGATAIGAKIGNANSLTTAGAKIVSFYSDNKITEKAYIDKDGTINSSGLVRGVSLESTVATGTAPLTVASTTKVTNLNADLLDGNDSSVFLTSASDYGRSGVATDLYESTTKLTDKYVKKAGDTMTGTLTSSATASFRAAAGSAAVPSYSFTSDPDTGLYWASADVIGISTGGVRRGLLTSSELYYDTILSNGANVLTLKGQSSDGTTAIGTTIGSYNALSTAGSKIASFVNATTEKAYIDKDGTIVSSGLVRAVSLESTVATGSAPLTIASSTLVTNLNADYLDGNHASAFATTGSLGNYVLKAGDTMTGTLTNSATSSFQAANGSAATPSYSFSGDPDTGIYNYSANVLGWTTGGAYSGILGGGYIRTGAHYASSGGTLSLVGSIANGATAIANKMGNENALSTTGAKIISFYSDNSVTEKAYIDKDGTIVSSGLVRGVSLESTIATGTAPLTVASSTVVTNLNADYLDGSHASAFATTGSLGNYVLKAGDTMTGTLTSSATASFQAASGSATVPSYSFAGDPDTGIYRIGADQLAFAVNGYYVGLISDSWMRAVAFTSYSAYSVDMVGQIPNGATAIGAKIGNANSLTTAGAKIVSFYNDNRITEKAYIDKDGTIVSSGLVRGTSLESTVATGTAPLTIASSTLVTNLNADYLDGNHASAFATTGSLGNYVLKAGDTMTGTLTIDAGKGLTVDTTTLYVDAANDRVGIGTMTPGGKLTIQSTDTQGYGNNTNYLSQKTSDGLSYFNISDTSGYWTVDAANGNGGSVIFKNGFGVYNGAYIGNANVGGSIYFGSDSSISIKNSGAVDYARFYSASNGLSLGTGYTGTAAPTNGMIIQGNLGIGTPTPGASLEVAGEVKATKYESTVATGSAPLTIASTTKVANLNADLLDDLDSSAFATTGSLGNYVLKAGDTMTGTLTSSATASFQAANGTVASPSYSFTNDPNTGFYKVADDDLRLAIGGALAAEFTSAGMYSNIVSPVSAVSMSLKGAVADGATAIGVKIGNTNTLSTSGAKIASFYSDNLSTEKAYIDKDGTIISSGLVRSVSLESTVAAGTAPLTVASSTVVTNLNADYLDGSHASAFATSSDLGNYVLKAGDTMTGTLTNTAGANFATSSGNVGIGTANPGYKLEVGSGQIAAPNGSAAAPSYTFTNDPDSGIYLSSPGNWRMSSNSAAILEMDASGVYVGASGILGSGNNITLVMKSFQADGATKTAVATDTYNAFVTPGAKLFSVRNAATEKAYIDKDGTIVSSGLVRGASLESTVATGSAPLTIASSTVVTNLNADLLDGSHASAFATTGSLGNYVLKAGDTMTGTLTIDAGKGLTVDTNTLYVDSANDRVGIGTTSPSEKLEIDSGRIKLTGSGAAWETVNGIEFNDTISSGAARRWSISSGTAATGKLVFRVGTTQTGDPWVNGSTKMVIDNLGNVGIGTTNPGAKLQIYSGGTDYAEVKIESLARTPSVHFKQGANDWYWKVDHTDSKFKITKDSSDFVTIDTLGNVGIGTTTPGALLDIAGKATIEADGDITTSAQLKSSVATGTAPLTVASSTLVTNLNADKLDGHEWSEVPSMANYVLKAGDTMTGTLTNTAGANFATSSGNVGIGTTSPAALLQVSGVDNSEMLRLSYSPDPSHYNLRLKQVVTAGNVAWVYDQLNNTSTYSNVMSINAGNIGIGTGSPGYKLDIEGVARVSDTLRMHINDYVDGIPSYPFKIVATPAYNNGPANLMDFYVANGTAGAGTEALRQTRVMTLNGSGNVGIGTTSPLSKLSVGGDGLADTGVYGTGTTYGIYGTDGTRYGYLGSGSYGVYGTDGTNYGYLGGATYGIYGRGTVGIWGSNISDGNKYGYLGGGDYGVYGQYSASNYGYLGSANYGVYGSNGTNTGGLGGTYGAYGNSAAGYGVRGNSETGYGVTGILSGTTGRAVWGSAYNGSGTETYGGYFNSAGTSGYGVVGENTAASGTTYGVYGAVTSATGWAGYFTGGRGIYTSRILAGPLIAEPSTTWEAYVNGDIDVTGNMCTAGLINNLYAYNNGVGGLMQVLYVDSAGNFGYKTSSRRYKHDIVDYDFDVSRVEKLRPVKFRYNNGNNLDIGLIAEEVSEQFPELVIYDKAGRPDSVSYEKVAVVLLKAYQEKQKEINELKTRLNSLESKLTTVLEKIDSKPVTDKGTPVSMVFDK